MQPAVAAVEKRRVRRDREQEREHRAQPVAHAHGTVDSAHADVHVQAEGVVTPGDVFEARLDAPVVLGVDDVLLAIVGPWVRPRCAEGDPLRGGKREQAPPVLALVSERVGQVDARARDDLDLRGDELARDRRAQLGVRVGGGGAHLLVARDQFEGLRVEDRELLLDPDGEVGGLRESIRGEV